LLAFRDDKREPLLILTDLSPEGADPGWYLMRFWIERQFKILKSAAMQLERSRMRATDRFERILLPATIAMIYNISAGNECESQQPPDYNLAMCQRVRPNGVPGRRNSLVRVGAIIVRLRLISNQPAPNLQMPPLTWTSRNLDNST